MKKITLVLLVLATQQLFSQTSITGHISHLVSGSTVEINAPFSSWEYSTNTTEATLSADGSFSATIHTTQPQFVIMHCGQLRIKIYAEPGKNVDLSFDANDYIKSLNFKGTLSAANNICTTTGLSFFTLYPAGYNDSLSAPGEVLSAMKVAQAKSLAVVNASNANISAECKKLLQAEIAYLPAAKLVELSFKNNAWTTDQTASLRFPLTAWKGAIAKAYDDNPLSSDNAVNSYNYLTVIDNLPFFIQRRFDEKKDMVDLVEKIMGCPFDDAIQQLRTKGKQYFDYKTYAYYLHGAALERTLACFIDKEVNEAELSCLDEVYANFTGRFPASVYNGHVQLAMSAYLAMKDFNEGDARFITDTALAFKDMVATFKGKIVYIDVWGTWCPACREEMKYNSVVKHQYEDKPVAFVYIAFEHNTSPEKNWRQTIRFLHIKGSHILAGSAMQQYIGNLYEKGQLVFPSYILIDKNGNIVNTQAAPPSSPGELYKQIDALL